MSFSIKNIFQKGDAPNSGGAMMIEPQQAGFGGHQGSPSPFSAASADPAGFGGTLFRTVGGGEPMDGAPIAPGASPFSPFGAATSAVITVGDILPQLPPEIARANGAMPDQPVTISPQALENAITSGQLAVPMFEIYRVCPALFQAPVSPHDPRLVALPKSKLPGLIAAHTSALKPQGYQQAPSSAPPQQQAQSPFAAAPMQQQPQMPMQMPQQPSPFAPALPELAPSPAGGNPQSGPMTGGLRPAGSLPPRRPQGMPPPIPTQADFAAAAGSLTLPGQMLAHDPQRPSSRPLMTSGSESPMQPMGSPFGSMPPQSGPQTSLLFGSQPTPADPELEASARQPQPMAPSAMPMFGSPTPPALPASPFASAPHAQPAPFSMPSATPSPFAAPSGAPFAVPAVASFEVTPRHVEPEPPRIGNLPFAAQANPAPAPLMRPPSRPLMGGVSPAMGMANDPFMEVSLAAVLRGLTAQELGFDPSFIPAWITTKLPAAEVREQLSTGRVVLELGCIIDGTDNTFKSVIQHGRRDFKVNIAASEVFQTMQPANSAGAPPIQPAPAPFAPPMPAAAPFAFGPESARPVTSPIQPMPTAFAAPFAAARPSPTAPLMPTGPSPFPVPPSAGEFTSTPMFMPDHQRDNQGASPLLGTESRQLAPMFAPAPEAKQPSQPLFAATPVQPPASEPNPFFGGAPVAQPMASEPAMTFEQSRTPSKPLGMMADMSKVFGSNSPPAQVSALPPAPVTHAAPASAPLKSFAASPAPSPGAFDMTVATDEDQLVLRAMLGVGDKLDISRVIELAARLPGIAACAYVRDSRVVAHGDSSQASQDFRQQAPEIARSMRTLAEVTGLNAETLSVATRERLITFCFQGGSSFGVIHTDKEPPAGLREKITLLSREVAQMSA